LRLALEPATRIPRVPWWAVLVVAGWITAVAVIHARGLAIGGEPPVVCTFRRMTGVPCATCGSTRAAFALARGDLFAALLLNPLVVVTGAVLALILLARLVSARRLRLELSRPGRWLAWSIAAVLFAANWAWVIWRHA
jgi:hypothetical protein